MANAPLGTVIGRIKRLAGPPAQPLTDRELLQRFSANGDESAFAQLVERHGAMVLGCCRRILGNSHDAEDAFQATFMVLARRAVALTWDESIGHWLYQVAYRTAQKVRVTTIRRKVRERRAGEMSRTESVDEEPLDRLQAILDEEVQRLPTAYHMPIVLCCLQGCSHAQAAEQLTVTEGTIRARLWRGRELLRRRLERRGIALPAALLTTFLVQGTTTAAPPTELITRTVLAAQGFANGTPPTPLHESSTLLAEGVLRSMLQSKTHLMIALVLTLALTATGIGLVSQRLQAEPPVEPNPPVAPVAPAAPRLLEAAAPADDDDDAEKPKQAKQVSGPIQAVFAEKKTLTIQLEEEDEKLFTFTVASDAKLHFAGKPIQLDELRPGMQVKATLNSTETALAAIDANWPVLRTKLKNVDAANQKLTIAIESDNQEFELPYVVRPDATITVDGLKAGLADVSGDEVLVNFSADRKQVVAIETRSKRTNIVPAVLLNLDTTNQTMLVSIWAGNGFNERKIELRFTIAADAKVRYHDKSVMLADLKAGSQLRLTLAPDHRTVVGVLADDQVPPDEDND